MCNQAEQPALYQRIYILFSYQDLQDTLHDF